MQQQTMERPAAPASASSQEAPVNSGKPRPTDGLTVAGYILEQLSAWGVRRIYGVIGDANLYLLDALAKQNRISYIACRHEESAALMASAEAKLTGRIAVCMATSGPGAANLLNGLADAASDHVPVLALTGQVDTAKIGTAAKQYIDQQKLLSALTECSELLAHPDALPELLETALTTAAAFGKLAHISIPKDLYTQPVAGTVKPYPAHLRQPLAVPEAEVRAAAELLRSAVRPALLVGSGAAWATEAVLAIAEALPAAVVTTLPARPLFPNDHELYAGGLGQAGSEASSVLLGESDLVVMLGATWWPDEYVPTQAKVLQIDRAAAQIGRGHPLHKGIVGDAAELLPRLVSQLGSQPGPDRGAWRRRIAEVSGAWKAQLEREAGGETGEQVGGSPNGEAAADAAIYAGAGTGGGAPLAAPLTLGASASGAAAGAASSVGVPASAPIAPQRVIRAVAEACAEEAIIAVDTGDHTLWFNRVFQAKPRQRILVSGRWRTLGFALPAAIAAKLEEPQRQVVAIAGDGGVVQTIMELQTAALYRLSIVLIVINNGCYAMERNRMVVAGLDTLGSELANPDFAKLAECCGAAGYRADTVPQLEGALRQAFAASVPALIDVRTAPTAVPHPKL